MRKEQNAEKKNLATYWQKSTTQSVFFISCLRLGSLFETCSPNPDLGSADIAIVA